MLVLAVNSPDEDRLWIFSWLEDNEAEAAIGAAVGLLEGTDVGLSILVTDATFVSVVLVVRALGPLLRLFLLLLALPLLLLLLFSLAVATVTADTEAGGTGGACMDDAA